MTFLTVYVLIGILLSPLSYAITFAYFQRKFPLIAEQRCEVDKSTARIMTIATTISPTFIIFLLVFSEGVRYGLKWK